MTVFTKKKKHVTDGTIVTAIDSVQGDAPKNAYILFLTGPLVGKLQMLEEGCTVIGRSPECTLVMADTRVSRQHCEVDVTQGTAVIRDLGSTNGTFVNGERKAQHILQDGDKIQISSNTIFKFALQDHTENIFHKELYKMAVVDALTNIHNKRYFLERFKEEMSHSKRNDKPLSLIMLDIDHFKAVNDTHGHLAGDMVLQQVAQKLQGIVRTEDLLARYGGEEFAILLRGANEANAVMLAERMREKVAEAPVRHEGTDIAVTISLGIATQDDETVYDTTDAFIAAADQCLYYSKEHGRNQVTPRSQYTT